ncbi:MAG: tetratricopeptide repeat protein [Bacteroidota bacterium]
MKNTLYLLFLVFCFSVSFAQTPIRVDVADVKQEELFIDAQREKVLGNYEKAEALFKAILDKTTENATVYFSLAQVLSQLEKDEEAVQMAEKAVAFEPDNTWYKIYLSEIYEKTGNDLKAAQVYEQLAKSNPDKIDYYNSWAFYLIRAQKIEEAIEVYNLIEKQQGISETTIRKKHTLYLGLGNTKKAGKELETLAKNFPQQLEYQHLLAACYTQFNQADKAKSVYQNILSINPDDPKALMALKGKGDSNSKDIYAQLGFLFEKSSIKIDDKIKELLPLIQDAIQSNNPSKLDKTLELTATLVKVHPEEAKAYAARGDLLYHKGELEEAKIAYLKTIELDESVYPVWEQLMYIYWQQKEYNALIDAAEEAIDIFPNQARIYFMNGLALQELKDHEDALDLFQEASLMVSGNQQLKADLLRQMGISYQELKQYAQADKIFEQAVALNPTSSALLNAYSYALAKRGEQLPKAAQMIEKAIKQSPNQAILEHTYAWVLYKQGKFKDARKWMESAIEKQADALFIEHYGDILFKLGDKEAALANWKKAQEMGMQSKELERKIAEQKLN